MPCESCNVQFGLITRKKSCYECRRLFCKNCLEKRQEKILCHNCLIFTKRPLSKLDLGQLKVKDLIFYLQSKHISTSGCVEKDDLINLVITHVNSGASSPLGSTGSNGGARTFNASSASSTGGSSGGGAGGDRGSHSGASSRYGHFYAAGAENCANTFDQIKNTCQNLFSSLTDKLNADIPKAPDVGSRFSASPTGDNNQPRVRPDSNVFQQPRFGSNDVYQVNENASSAPTSPRVAGSGRSEIVPNERNFSPTIDDSGGSGTTSGADSSANTSTVSSPEHSRGMPNAKVDHKLAINIRIENILASDTNQDGCDCSDDEDGEAKDAATCEKETKIVSPEDSLHTEPGPSQQGPVYMAVPESKTNTSSSSFDDLNPECTQSGEEAAASTDTENWQIINNPDSAGINEILPPTVDPTSASAIIETITSTTTPSGSHQIRRRSDSYLIAGIMNKECTSISDTHPVGELDARAHSSQITTTNKCFKCGKRRNGLRKQLKKFRKQLLTATGSEIEKQHQLEAFLSYLERRSKGSLELSDTESITEEASISAAEGDSLAVPGVPIPQTGGSSIDEHRQPSSYPQADEEMFERINMYSSGNQELANMSHIKLSDIKESADLDVLSVKQLKEILMLNRVDFKGCCEKPELRERVLRLWRDFKSIPSIEKLQSDDLCKICMDAPIECVILECGHMTTCTACGKVLSECPICRQYIVRVVRFFRA